MSKAAIAYKTKKMVRTTADLKAKDLPPEADTDAGLKMCLAIAGYTDHEWKGPLPLEPRELHILLFWFAEAHGDSNSLQLHLG